MYPSLWILHSFFFKRKKSNFSYAVWQIWQPGKSIGKIELSRNMYSIRFVFKSYRTLPYIRFFDFELSWGQKNDRKWIYLIEYNEDKHHLLTFVETINIGILLQCMNLVWKNPSTFNYNKNVSFIGFLEYFTTILIFAQVFWNPSLTNSKRELLKRFFPSSKLKGNTEQ